MPSFGAPALFGYLEQDGRDNSASGKYEILDGRELLIGRDDKTCDVTLRDPIISNQHLQIYTIAYTEDNYQRTYVYAKDLSANGSYWRYKHGNHWRESLIGKGSAVLLSDGDKVRLCNGCSFAFRSVFKNPERSEDASTVQGEDTKLFTNLFRVSDRKLGSGAYGEVWMAVDIACKRQMACKMVKLGTSPQKRSGRVSFSEPLWREVELLKDLSHPNIIHVERVFFTNRNLFIISDLITGGDLMSYLERPWIHIDDAEASLIVYQILRALEYLHGQGICHRDLKPENILLTKPAPGARVILADFGHSTKLSGGKQFRSRRMKTASVGTNYYVAPEIRGKNKNTKGYTMAADMWSIGVITTLLLTGESVFENSKDKYASSAAFLDAAAECDLAKMDHDPLWQTVSDLGKEFVKGLLVLDEKLRLEVEQALKHGWFTNRKRKRTIQQEYEDAIRGWMPSRPLLDFKEDLALFREASKCTLDSILMPPPAKPNPNRFLRRRLQQLGNGQQSSPFFSRATHDGATKIAAQVGKKREVESDDEACTPSTCPKQAVPASKRQNKLAESSAKRAVEGECETLLQFDSSQRIQQSRADLDYEEGKLHDRVSREEASIFRSAKSYGQSVEKRRRLGV